MAINITVWTILHWKAFLWSCLLRKRVLRTAEFLLRSKSQKLSLQKELAINKFVLPLEIIATIAVVAMVTVLVNGTVPSDPPLLKINY